MILRAYKVQLDVNNKQQTLLLQHIGCARWVDVTFSNNCSALNQLTKTLDWTISTSQYSIAYWKPANG